MTWIRFFFLQQKQGSTCKKWRITRIRKLNNFISRNRIVFIVSYFISSLEVVLSLRVFQICLDMGGGKKTLFILFLISPFPRRRTKLPLVTWFQTCNKCKTPKCVHSTAKFISASALQMGGYCCLCCVWRTFVIK